MSVNGRRARACKDRCEVCEVVLVARPVPNRRRCFDHLDQLALVPLSAVRRPGRQSSECRGSDQR